MKQTTLALGFSIAALVASPAAADIVMVSASSIQGDNVLFNMGVQTDTTVFGHTQAGTDVAFTGTSNAGTTIRANGGQARIEGALDTSTPNPNDTFTLDSLSFDLVGGNTFNNLEFNLFGGDATAATFTILDNQGETTVFSGNALGNGSNFFGFQGINGQSISNVSISFTGGGVGDVRQIRLDEVTAGAVPEPASWALMIAGFGGVGMILRRSRRQGAVGAA